MRSIFSLSDAGHSLLLILMFLTWCFQMFVCCMGYFSKAKWIHCKFLFVLAAPTLLLLSFLAAGTARQTADEPMWTITRKLMDIPAAAVFVFIALVSGYACWIMWHEWRYRKVNITRASVREGADLMPMGLCFFKGNGQLIMVNLKMEKLSHLLCGEALQNGESFWQTISHGDLKSGAQRSRVMDVPAVILPDKKAWLFDRQVIYVDGEEIVQVTAMDATELYDLSNKLKQENSVLRSMNARLKVYGRRVDDLARMQQRLAMKIQIHDSIGQNLMMTRHYLLQEAQGASNQDPALILQNWQHTIALLRREVEPDESKGAFQYLIDAAESAGVEVLLQGELPQESRVVELITAAGAEALTNAVRHADAKQLRMKVSQTDLVCSVVFTNDGRRPEKPLQEGGGLTGLRRRIEGEGGTMTVSADPEFSLTVTIPKEGKVNVI